MSEPFLGEIRIFAGNFAPVGWAICAGQTMDISQNNALFAILGTTYGGNGMTTFQLPNLQGRVVMGMGDNYTIGEVGGSETVTLTTFNLPTHSHPLNVVNTAGNTDNPSNALLAGGTGQPAYTNTAANATAAAAAIGSAGGGQPAKIMQPFLVINFIIALQGIFPSRN